MVPGRTFTMEERLEYFAANRPSEQTVSPYPPIPPQDSVYALNMTVHYSVQADGSIRFVENRT